MTPGASSRWCPTPEQLMILEEMYKGGIRTPNASQIQQITAHLSYYGKIEGKNVFYWFQNHKARDRQKLRRKLFTKQIQQQQYQQQQLQLMQYNNNQIHNQQQHFLPQLSHHYNPLGFLPHLGGVEEAEAAAQMMSYSWKIDHDGTLPLPPPPPPGRAEIDKYMNRTCGCDWMMMMDVGPVPPLPPPPPTVSSCISRPLKTLELFPITSTGLKEDCSPSNQTASFFPTKP